MKVRANLILIVVVLITLISTRANTEESISSKDKAIELAKHCLIVSESEGAGKGYTVEESIKLLSRGGQDVLAIGWNAIDVSESLYTVVFKYRIDGKNTCHLFNVNLKDNVAQFINNRKGEEVIEKYLDNLMSITTYTKDKFSLKMILLILMMPADEEGEEP